MTVVGSVINKKNEETGTPGHEIYIWVKKGINNQELVCVYAEFENNHCQDVMINDITADHLVSRSLFNFTKQVGNAIEKEQDGISYSPEDIVVCRYVNLEKRMLKYITFVGDGRHIERVPVNAEEREAVLLDVEKVKKRIKIKRVD